MRATLLILTCVAGLPAACANAPREPDSAFAERWRVSEILNTYASGKRTRAVIEYDESGRRIAIETRGDDAADRETVLYRFDADGNLDARVDVEHDDLDRYRFRIGDDGRIELRLRDGDGDGRFGSFVRHVFGPDGRAMRREYRELDGERKTIDGSEGELRHISTYRYRDGRLSVRSTDRAADGDVDERMLFRYENDGRLASITVEKDGRIDLTSTYTYERGPCDTGNLIPEALSFCVDD